MEGTNYISPSALNLRQNLPPQIQSSPSARFVIGDPKASTAQHLEMQSLLFDNQRLEEINVSIKQELSAAQNELRHLCSVADKIKPEKDAHVREVNDRAVKMEAEVKSIDESNSALALVLGDLQKLKSEKLELDDKLSKLRDDVDKASLELNQIPIIKSEIETMQKEIERGRAAIEQEKKVHASNIKESQAMENCKMFLALEIEKMKADVIVARERARAAGAVEQ